MSSNFIRLLLGNPLPSSAEAHHRLSKVKALAVFAADALSSVAYAPEEILLALALGGAAALQLSFPIAVVITALLVIVAVSYYQTIHGYPSGGGAYIVAHDNLGAKPGLVAAAALLVDYVMVVAVSATAGAAAITSAFPSLYPYRVYLVLLTIALITWANLRGVKESGTLFAIPIYGFIAIFYALILVGLFQALSGTLDTTPFPDAQALEVGAHPLMVFVVLRAFASGTTALTGIEAISNGIPAFQKPEARNAGKTLIAMATLLATMFLGIVFLVSALGIVPLEQQTVISQVGRRIFGTGPLYLILQVATAFILILAANTSFADFPRLAAILARDRYLPRQLASIGDRLVFSTGIVALALLASALAVIFRGETHRLIPLYAVGVFLSFTLSQAGMVRHWRNARNAGWKWKTAVNGLGALATGIVLVIIAANKFLQGAWVIVLVIPIIVWMFSGVKRHYLAVADQLSLQDMRPKKWTGLASKKRHKVVVPISGVHRGTLEALRFARSLSKDVTAVVVDVEPAMTERVQIYWETWGQDIPLVVLESPFRSTIGPLLGYLDEVDRREPSRGPAVVVLPEFIPAKWWHTLLHNQTARLIKRTLIYSRGINETDRVVIDVPYHLHR